MGTWLESHSAQTLIVLNISYGAPHHHQQLEMELTESDEKYPAVLRSVQSHTALTRCRPC